MPQVVLQRDVDGRRDLCGVIEEAQASACSRMIREKLRDLPGDCPLKVVTVRTGETAALKELLDLIRSDGPQLSILPGRYTLEEYVKLFEAAKALEVDSYLPPLEDDIKQHIRDYEMTAERLLAVCDTFEPRQRESNVYRILVEVIAQSLVYRDYPETTLAEFRAALETRPALSADVHHECSVVNPRENCMARPGPTVSSAEPSTPLRRIQRWWEREWKRS